MHQGCNTLCKHHPSNTNMHMAIIFWRCIIRTFVGGSTAGKTQPKTIVLMPLSMSNAAIMAATANVGQSCPMGLLRSSIKHPWDHPRVAVGWPPCPSEPYLVYCMISHSPRTGSIQRSRHTQEARLGGSWWHTLALLSPNLRLCA